MIKKYAVAGIAAFLVVISTNVFAEEKNQELSVFGFINSPSEPDGDPIILMNATAGHYFTPQLLGTLTVTMFGAGDLSSVGFGFGGKYYFSDGKKGDFVPFVLGEFMLSSSYMYTYPTTIDTSTTEFVFGGGAAYFLSETASFDARYTLKSGTTESSMETFTCNNFSCPGYQTTTSTYDTASTEILFGFTQRF